MDSDLWITLGIQVLTRLPILAALGVGIMLAVMRYGVHPEVSGLALLGFGLDVVLTLGGSVFAVLPPWLSAQGRSIADIGTLMSVLSGVMTVAHTAVWGLVVAAIFYGRSKAPGAAV